MAAKLLSDNQTDTIGSYLAARLVELGVRDYFAVPGDSNLVLLDELLKNQKLRLVGCCNELNAGCAADGYARANGVAACVATYSVGGLSFVNAIAGAYAEDLSVVAISGGPNTNTEPSRQYLHHTLGEISYRYVVEVFQRVTAHAVSIDDPACALQQIDRALDICVSRRKPVYLEIACNLAAWPCSAPKPYVFGAQEVVTSRPALQEAVDRAAGMLNAALKPVLVAGVKLRPHDGREAFARLVETSGYATAVMSNAKGMISEKLPEFIGVYWGAIGSPGVKEVIQSADAVLFAGPLFNDYTTCGYTMLLDRQKMIEVQPDAVVIAGHTYTNVTMKEFLGELAKKVKHNPASLRQFNQTKEETVPEPPMQPSKKLTRRRLFWLAQRVVTSNSAVIAETGDSWFNAIRLPLPEGCRFEIQMQYGSIGWSVGAIMGYAMGAAAMIVRKNCWSLGAASPGPIR